MRRAELKLVLYPEGEKITITDRKHVRLAVKDIYDGEYREVFTVLGLDNSNEVVFTHIVSIGDVGQCGVSTASVAKVLLLGNCSGAVVVHNHLGGTMSASESDKEVTKKIIKALDLFNISLVDHVILSGKNNDILSLKSSNRELWEV